MLHFLDRGSYFDWHSIFWQSWPDRCRGFHLHLETIGFGPLHHLFKFFLLFFLLKFIVWVFLINHFIWGFRVRVIIDDELVEDLIRDSVWWFLFLVLEKSTSLDRGWSASLLSQRTLGFAFFEIKAKLSSFDAFSFHMHLWLVVRYNLPISKFRQEALLLRRSLQQTVKVVVARSSPDRTLVNHFNRFFNACIREVAQFWIWTHFRRWSVVRNDLRVSYVVTLCRSFLLAAARKKLRRWIGFCPFNLFELLLWILHRFIIILCVRWTK